MWDLGKVTKYHIRFKVRAALVLAVLFLATSCTDDPSSADANLNIVYPGSGEMEEMYSHLEYDVFTTMDVSPSTTYIQDVVPEQYTRYSLFAASHHGSSVRDRVEWELLGGYVPESLASTASLTCSANYEFEELTEPEIKSALPIDVEIEVALANSQSRLEWPEDLSVLEEEPNSPDNPDGWDQVDRFQSITESSRGVTMQHFHLGVQRENLSIKVHLGSGKSSYDEEEWNDIAMSLIEDIEPRLVNE
ncbi:hypothetical protein [Haloglycomyces albus]|uniref:hypothetical protein n=1 Tax=Haloglycomyces albus TaxID=526067 RepID=UPI00046D5420|nr:hypothetical protein [Haloglycomyces albus]